MRFLFLGVLFVAIALLGSAAICNPEMLNQNEFLVAFLRHQLLSILAVIVTVTAASSANLHLSFNRAEEVSGKKGLFDEARKEVNRGAVLLLVLFLVALLALLIQAGIPDAPMVEASISAGLLVLLLLNVLVLIDLTLTIFAVHPLLNASTGHGSLGSSTNGENSQQSED